MENKPVTIGLHCSACGIELLELYLHAIHKIPIGKVIKHNWFKKPQEGQKVEPLAERKIGVDFPDKSVVYGLIYNIEELRENRVYGNALPTEVNAVHAAFQQEGINLEEI